MNAVPPVSAVASDSGRVLVFKHSYQTRFEGGVETRQVVPELSFPYGEQALLVMPDTDISSIALSDSDSELVLALVDGNSALAAEVVANDYRVNALEVEIDEECTRILALRQPAASDLRLVMAVIKTITDLERIGDEAKRVGKMVEAELHGALNEEVRQELEHMGDLVRNMLRLVLNAFARTDVDSAIGVVKADKKVDAKYVSITRQLMTYMAADAKSIPTILNILWAARAMERMGDRCGNIAEYIFYLVHGRDIRHTSLDDAVAEIAAEQD